MVERFLYLHQRFIEGIKIMKSKIGSEHWESYKRQFKLKRVDPMDHHWYKMSKEEKKKALRCL